MKANLLGSFSQAAKVRNICLVFLSISLFLASTINPVKANLNSAKQTESRQFLLASARNNCGDGFVAFFAGETKDFWINICGWLYPQFYKGIRKLDGAVVNVEITEVDLSNNVYQAIDGNIYYVISNTAQGRFLSITQGNRELLKQPLIDWFSLPYLQSSN
ncbi:MAG: hypothetical protein SAL07_20085 [Oscillatoria sp. PMC 1051.18]|nr:hypothetical protein [Oscillatoria sp. PMC 1050.18]MEC5032205.1 hypothetical protein [Oscillatoria sp. PMC 1051.18]